MRRTALVYVVPALLVATGWARLEQPRQVGAFLWVVVLALVPALAPTLRLRVGLAVAVTFLAAHTAFAVSPLHARPGQEFFGPLGSRFGSGFVDFYDYAVPIDPHRRVWMHGVLVAAVFGFSLALALAVAARRPLAAVVVLLVGAGWPATLLSDRHDLLRGSLILGGLLLLLAGLAGDRPAVLARAFLAAGALCLAALAASTSPAVAKTEFLRWQNWDFYTAPEQPVDVGYVWNSNYSGITFPRKPTTVLEIASPPISLYWRATTLDVFDNDRWLESLRPLGPNEPQIEPLEPAAARRPSSWITQRVTVEALRDPHLVGASEPVAYDAGSVPVVRATDDVAVIPDGLNRGDSYSVSSYAPRPTPAQLARSRPDYPAEIGHAGHFLEVNGNYYVPPFGTSGRPRLMRSLFATAPGLADISAYRPLYRQALRVAGAARTPYGAVAALEAWFRRTGGFVYDQHPPASRGVPPLVAFVMQTRRGYCQHFAGAMALMLRYLGIPARVAAGFTSGTWDAKRRRWIVTDHNAHTWVEVWFKGYGWLPFDPTPGRGRLSASYTSSSPRFSFRGLAALLPKGAQESVYNIKMNQDFAQRGIPRHHGPAADIPGNVSPTSAQRAGRNLLRVLLLLVLGAVALVALAKLMVRRLRYLTRDPRRLAHAYRAELVDYLRDQRIPLPEHTTLVELGELLDAELAVDAHAFVEAAALARYGPPTEADRAAVRARSELSHVRGRLRERLSRLERLRGLLSLRSLGFAG